MSDTLLVINAGSSSVKFAVFAAKAKDDPLDVLFRGGVDGIGITESGSFAVRDAASGDLLEGMDGAGSARIAMHDSAAARILAWLHAQENGRHLAAVGHRIVHGAADFSAPTLIDRDVLDRLRALEPLAPHHLPHSLGAVSALRERRGDLPQVACFDTGFHADAPARSTRIPLPQHYRREGIRRYGFHGLSYESIVTRFPALTGEPLPRRMVAAHLGNGGSLCAIRDGRSVATTMGFSTLDGICMGTRCGAVDPGVLLHLMREHGIDRAGLEDLLYNRSGLLALAGTSDMRELLARDDDAARTALDYYCHRIVRGAADMAAAMGGIDALVFTGGVGENAAEVRARVCSELAWLGLGLDRAANAADACRLSPPGSSVTAWRIPTDEERVIADHTLRTAGLDHAATPKAVRQRPPALNRARQQTE